MHPSPDFLNLLFFSSPLLLVEPPCKQKAGQLPLACVAQLILFPELLVYLNRVCSSEK